ncbi:MAG: hypothetical protein ABH803_04110 [Candidatus Micrarchaeota archaeon]
MDYAFSFESKDVQALKKVLEADSMNKDSFARLGYYLKEGKNLSLKEGRYYVSFKTENKELAGKLIEKLKAIPSFEEATTEEESKLAEKIEEEENAATTGFGSIFE